MAGAAMHRAGRARAPRPAARCPGTGI